MEDTKKVSILLTVIGMEGYRDLCTPVLPSTKSFEELLKLITYNSNQARSLKDINLKSAWHGGDESIVQFIASLKKVSINYCNFDDNLKSAGQPDVIK